MQDIAQWLEQHGLGQYAQRFAEHDIDFGVLPDLTDDDLKELGLSSLGHRRKLLRAIANLQAKPQSAPEAPIAPNPHDAAERRQVTVIFSDLVGSTALAARMDPEDLRDVIAAYQTCVAETVRRLGGFVAKYLGDGVLIYFGYPEAHEDDAERAVRAGLELIAAIAALKSPVVLQTRIGIATGMVVVGDLIGSGDAQERGIVGDTPNLAARLQGIAEPNTVVISEGTRRLIGNLFDLHDLKPAELKGIAGPTRAWVALRSSAAESRFEAMHATGLTSLVGREGEEEVMARRWAQAKGGEGQVVLLSGEAGIGKSRLTAAFLERIAGTPHTPLRYFCSPHHAESAFFPIITQMERAAGIAYGDAAAARLDKLDAVLAETSTSVQDRLLIADLLSLPNDGRYPAIELTPQQRRQKILDALNSQIETLTRQRPVLMIVEDAHWIDPTTLESLGRIVDLIRALPVFLIVTFRPEFSAPWIGQPHVVAMTINRLTQRDVGAIIDHVIGAKLLPANIRQDIVERTDGIPLFVEEMTKAVLEAESEDQARRTAAAVPSAALAVPATLHASLMARLDRLGPAKRVAQVGAAIGREFSHALLAAVVQDSAAALQSALDRLVQAGLLSRHGLPPDATYLFKHALVQDAAYHTLLREPRRALHARIADALEHEFAEVENRPEVLAHHCGKAGLNEKAAILWGKAGQQSLTRSALIEASEQLTRALNQIDALPGSPDLRRERIKLQVALIHPLSHLVGFAAPETIAAVERARFLIEQAEALGEPADDPMLLFSVLFGGWVTNMVSFDGDMVCTLAVQFLALAEKQKAMLPLMIGHRIMGSALLFTGDIAASRSHYDRAIALNAPVENPQLATFAGAAYCYRSIAMWILGYPDAALRDTADALKDARAGGQAALVMYALAHTALIDTLRGDCRAMATKIDELVGLAEDKNAPIWKAWGLKSRGMLHALNGETANAVPMLEAGISLFRSTGGTHYVPFRLSELALAHAELSRWDDAWRCIDEATAAVEKTRERWAEAEIHRSAGIISLMAPAVAPTDAETYFARALDIARGQKARSWELRAATNLARLWRDQGKTEQARDLLAPVYGWFTEGFDTLDLRHAKALLDEMVS